MADILYRSDRLEVRQVVAGDGRARVVTFDPYHAIPGTDRPAFGEQYFVEQGITAIHLLSHANDWFQYPETARVLRLIAQAVEGADHVLSYGSSMGGYAALRFAAAVGADTALALSPQFSLDRRKVPFERRWAQDQRRIRFRDELDGPIRAVPRMVIAYDPMLSADRHHAELFEDATLLPLPHAGHPVGAFLADVALLHPLVMSMLAGTFDPARLLRAARTRRSGSPQYLAHLAEGQPAWRPASAVALATRAAELAPDRAPILNALGLRLSAAGRFADAIAAHQRALALEPIADYQWGLSKTLFAAGDLAGALRVTRILQALAPDVAGYHAWAAKLQSLLGDPVGELADLKRALALDPANRAYRFVVRKRGWQIRIARWLRRA